MHLNNLVPYIDIKSISFSTKYVKLKPNVNTRLIYTIHQFPIHVINYLDGIFFWQSIKTRSTHNFTCSKYIALKQTISIQQTIIKRFFADNAFYKTSKFPRPESEPEPGEHPSIIIHRHELRFVVSRSQRVRRFFELALKCIL